MDAHRGRLLVLLVALTFAATTVVKLGDADIFWHCAAGRWILEHGQIPRSDPFSYSAAGPWKYTEALAQVLFALVERAGGVGAIVWFNAALLLGLALLVAACCSAPAGASALVLAWVGAASHMAFEPKPQTFSYLGFAGLLWLLRGARRLYLVPVLFFVWGYLHRGGTLGLMVLAGGAVVSLLFEPRRRALRLVAVALASALALALNPGGLFYFRSAFDIAASAGYHAHLAEWQALTWANLVANHALLVPLVACALFERVRTRDAPDVELVALVVALALAVPTARFVPFAAIAAAAPASRGLAALLDRAERAVGPTVPPVAWQLLPSTLAFASLLGWVLPRVAPASWGPGVIDSLVPVHLAEVVRATPARGHLYHSFDFGGYFVYALAPERKVLIDGRNDTVYDERFFLQVLRADVEPAAFAQLDRKYRFELAAVRWQPDDARGLFLARDPAWALLAWDDRGAVYVRRDAVDAAWLAQHAYQELRVDTAFARAASPPDEHDARFLAELDRNTREAPHSARAWMVAALAYRTRGLAQAYDAARTRLVGLTVERR